jgi:hypothetical protein
MKWPVEDYPGDDYVPPHRFSAILGDSTPYVATVSFVPNNDICGEGYRGYDYTIIFDNLKFNSELWIFNDQIANCNVHN